MAKLEATVAAREKETSAAAQKKEADLQKRILAEFIKATFGRTYRIVQNDTVLEGAKILEPASTHDLWPCYALFTSSCRHTIAVFIGFENIMLVRLV